MSDEKKPGCLGRMLRGAGCGLLALVLLFALLIGGFLVYSGAVYNRFVKLPQIEKDVIAFATQVQPVKLDDGWNEYRCVLHTHSEFSHDSSVPQSRILEAAKNVGIDAVFMTDHCVEGHANFSLQWNGMYDGVLFVRGFEMSDGFLLWNMPQDTSILCMMQPEQIAQMAEERGGLLFYAHSEEDRLWDLPQYKGMEIYNIHTDLKDENLAMVLPSVLLCYKRYPMLSLRILFDRHPDIMAHWDELNKTRRITGFAANDTHQNNGIRLIYNLDGQFELWEAGPKFVTTFNPLVSSLLKAYYQPKEKGETVLNFYIDKYEHSINFSNTHVLAREQTTDSLIESLVQGRVFVAFNMLAPAKGFTFFAEDGPLKAVMGEDLALTPNMKLRAEAPLPGRFIVVKDGLPVHTSEGSTLDYTPQEPGQYRLEVELMVAGEWTPWIYTNRIRLN